MCTVKETVHYSLEVDFPVASTEPLGLSARFSTTSQQGKQEAKRTHVRSIQSEWPGDSSEAGQRQCQEWHQYRLGRPHEEKVEESPKL